VSSHLSAPLEWTVGFVARSVFWLGLVYNSMLPDLKTADATGAYTDFAGLRAYWAAEAPKAGGRTLASFGAAEEIASVTGARARTAVAAIKSPSVDAFGQGEKAKPKRSLSDSPTTASRGTIR
jgi:hypothetical protein